MRDFLNNPIALATGAVLLLHRLVRLLREMLELRNDWRRRDR
jgi:hypothetical protein